MKRMVGILIFSFMSVLLVAQKFSRDEAIRKSLLEIIVPPTLDHSVTAYITKEPLKVGDVIRPFLDGKEKRISKPCWFVWINDNPEGFFAHKTRYVFIDSETGKHEIKVEEWWPTLNDENLFMSDKERIDLDLIIYSDLHRSIPGN